MIDRTTCTRAAALLALPLSLALAAPAFAKGGDSGGPMMEDPTCDDAGRKGLQISGAELAESLKKGSKEEGELAALTREIGTVGNVLVVEDYGAVQVVFQNADARRTFAFGEDGPMGCMDSDRNPWGGGEPCYLMAPGFGLATRVVELVVAIIEGDRYLPVDNVFCPPGYEAYVDTVTGEFLCLDSQGNEAPELPEDDEPIDFEPPSCQSIFDAFFASCVAPLPPEPFAQLIGRGVCHSLAALASHQANMDGLCVD